MSALAHPAPVPFPRLAATLPPLRLALDRTGTGGVMLSGLLGLVNFPPPVGAELPASSGGRGKGGRIIVESNFRIGFLTVLS